MGFLLHHSIDESAQRDSERQAFRFEGAAISYRELVARSNRCANLLIDRGVKPNDRVGVYMNKGLELPVALYGILKAGAAYVPIDPSAPLARVQFIVEDCDIRHLVTNASRAARAREVAAAAPNLRCVIGAAEVGGPADTGEASAPTGTGATATFVDSGEVVPAGTSELISWKAVDDAPSHDPGIRLVDQDLAYIMYTSGSTGVPKGLMHTHASGRSYAVLSAREYGVQPEDRLGNHSPLHFDMSTFEYLTGPLCGATTVIIPEETIMFPRSLAELIEAEKLTFWYSVPLALIQLLERGDIERRDCSSLRWVLFGGEPFPPKHLARLAEQWPQARFSNSYGPAEVNQCTAYHVPRGPIDPEDAVPIGPVWPGAEGMIVGKDGLEVAAGAQGELLIRSPTMMKGYWSRPDLNRMAFFRTTVFPDYEKVFYRTGDLVREHDDGNLMFLGRKDRQIKIRGYRVELDEVENVVGSLPEVAEAAAVSVRGADGNVAIVAAVLLREGVTADADSLRSGAARKLSAYAVPSRIDLRDSFPRTGTGKIDRRALEESYESATRGGDPTPP